MSRVHYLEGDYEQLVINETIDGLFFQLSYRPQFIAKRIFPL
mgnify:FL=1